MTQDAAAIVNATPALEAREITRRFPGVLANDRVSFDVLPGEVHALLGENGSGKTTLCKILAGLYRPDSGELLVDGHPVRFASPRDAYRAGVFMVQQHFSLVEQLTVAENAVLGWSRGGRLLLRRNEIERDVAETADQFHLDIRPSAHVWQLSLGERQRVEILKALYRGARILILDEPTTVLTPQECEHLFESLRSMAASGTAVVFISHKLREVMAVCDRVTVLRNGSRVGSVRPDRDQVDTRLLAQMMVGREVDFTTRPPSQPPTSPVVLQVDNVSVANDFAHLRVNGISLAVRRGEIVGVAGVAGNGQRELAEAITGLRPRRSGQVAVSGRVLRSGDPRDAIGAGVAYVPEDRLRTGLVPTLCLTDNVLLKEYRTEQFSWGPVLRQKRALSRTTELLEQFDVRGRPGNAVRQLSGGNAQKLLLAREMSSSPAVLVVADPTQGLDVAATSSVRSLLVDAAEQGAAVLLISEDLDEVLDLANRVAVIYDGRIMGVLERRLDTPVWLAPLVALASLVVALAVAGVVLLISNHDPLSTYRSILQAGFTSPGAFSATLVNATPLLLTGLCAGVAFRMRIYNIGGEGQLYMGAMGAAGVGIALGGHAAPLVIAAMMLGGILAGALWAAIPGVLRSHLNTNEILTSLMLNYVAGLFIYYLIFNSHSYWRDLATASAKMYPQGKTVAHTDWWPALHLGGVSLPLGFLVGSALAAAGWWALRSTKAGFQLRVVAGSPEAARYAGMRTKRAVLVVMLVSGALAGLAGASQVGDFSHLLDPTGLQQSQFGYTGIVAAALVQFDPLATVVGAIFLGALTNAGFQLQGATFPQGLVGVIEGIILFCVLGAELFTLYRIRLGARSRRPTGQASPASSPITQAAASHQPVPTLNDAVRAP